MTRADRSVSTDGHAFLEGLADSQEQLRNLFENTIDGVVYTDADDAVVRVNPAACVILERSEPQIRGWRFAEMVAPEDARLHPLCERRAMTGRASGQLTLMRGNGSRFEAEVWSAEYAAADGSLRTFVVFRDITSRLDAAQQILELNAQLGERVRQLTAELEAANAELKALTQALAHDLQSPAAAIDAFSELLEHALPPPLPPRAMHYLGRIRAAAGKTTEYAQGLLSLARASQATLCPQQVDLSAIATDVLAQLAERDRDRKVEWKVQHGLRAVGDATLLRMTLDNLLGNAWKFSSRKAQARIEFAAHTGADGSVTYRVRDNGDGFDMAYADRLFGSFQRLHTEEEFPGTGIGLSNVQRIIQRHGGRIWAEAKAGEGACFYFTLALAPSSPA